MAGHATKWLVAAQALANKELTNAQMHATASTTAHNSIVKNLDGRFETRVMEKSRYEGGFRYNLTEYN